MLAEATYKQCKIFFKKGNRATGNYSIMINSYTYGSDRHY